ncbi:MAG: 50S ribosomal protein L23 [Parcubacteria group bacterium GW2011_GWC2_39_11]|nr:MAG: 50S ribosomal protein L23 [Parcubacteria group bacterium GW2011_GWA2_38_27]KKQ96716.1 MAG: 50S ribosomal protein L23 [Parcubacteria group bacterium GW2011_GWC2_39_11]
MVIEIRKRKIENYLISYFYFLLSISNFHQLISVIMSFLDFLRKKEIQKKSKKPAEKVEKEQPAIKSSPKKEESVLAIAARKKKKEIPETACMVLDFPHVTEKSTEAEKQNKYVFRVLPKSNKYEIKRAIEELYGVDVLGVRVVNVPKKKRRVGRSIGWRKGYKKAIVKLGAGQKIEIMPR